MNRRRFIAAIGAALAAFGLRGVSARSHDDPDWYHATERMLPDDTPRVYLNGEDWTMRGCECNTRAGWIVAYDAEPVQESSGWILSSVRRKHFGKVELRSA